MTPLIALCTIIATPFVLSLITRVKPLHMFVAIVTGYFWALFLGETAELVLRSFVHMNSPDVVARVILFLMPIIAAFLFMRGGVSAKSLPFQLIIVFGNSLLAATFFIELLHYNVQQNLYSSAVGSVFHQARDVGIAAIAAVHLGLLIGTPTKHHDSHRGKKH